MFSWLAKNEKTQEPAFYDNVVSGLKHIYKTKIYPLEVEYLFHEFHSPALSDPDFDAKPMILLVGQYSTGKTTFIKYLLEKDFPGIRIGPEPTTDRFNAVIYGDHDGIIPGNALVVDAKKQFRPLAKFGNTFLNRFQCSTVNSEVLKSLVIIDTPGILSGEKQRTDRGYDFAGVLEWFSERVDLIILLFDAHKLDISDEFARIIKILRCQDDKIRIILNKADMVNHQQLMRVYGALMWSLGKVLNTPEVSRVYLGSFWDQPMRYDYHRRLFEEDEQDLFSDLQSLPRNAALRKLNDLIKRARLAKVHACIIGYLGSRGRKKKKLIKELEKVYTEIEQEFHIPFGDFPDIEEMQEKLIKFDFLKFSPLKPKLVEAVTKVLNDDIARLMDHIPKEQHAEDDTQVKGGAFDGVQQNSPFTFGRGEGIDEGSMDSEWIVSRDKPKYDEIFQSLGPVDGKLDASSAKTHMVKSKLPSSVLGKIWQLSDVDNDGMLDSDEFALCMHLICIKLKGHDLPAELPAHLIPPSKKNPSPLVSKNTTNK